MTYYYTTSFLSKYYIIDIKWTTIPLSTTDNLIRNTGLFGAFLFAAFALAFQASAKNDVSPSALPFFKYVLAGISSVGILSALYLSSGLAAAHNQHNQLRDWWKARPKQDSNRHPDICGESPRFLLTLPYFGFPFVFVLGWVVFLLVTLRDFLSVYANTIGITLLVIVAIFGLIVIGYVFGSRRASAH